MLGPLVMFFILIPVIEIFVFMRVGGAIGVGNTIFLLIIMAILGVGLAKSQGRALFLQSQAALARGEMPADAAVHGILIFFGGVLMVIPGFFTDVIGLIFVLPGTRHLVALFLQRSLARQMKQGRVRVFRTGSAGHGPFTTEDQHAQARDVSPKVIDVTPIRTEKTTSKTDGGKDGPTEV